MMVAKARSAGEADPFLDGFRFIRRLREFVRGHGLRAVGTEGEIRVADGLRSAGLLLTVCLGLGGRHGVSFGLVIKD